MPIRSRRFNRLFTGLATSITGWSTLPTLSDRLEHFEAHLRPSVERHHKTDGTVPTVSESKRLAHGHGDNVMKTPAIPIPFHKLLKVVAIVELEKPGVKQLLDRIGAENFELEISSSFERDVSEDAS